jgi:DNA polymerase (family 10)
MGRDFSNQQIADLLDQVAAAYIVKRGNPFKIAAYERAAVAVEHATSAVKDLWDEGKLEEIPGIGENIASYLDELFRFGKVAHFEKLMQDLPPAMFVLLNLPGVGAKTAYHLCKELGLYQEKTALNKLKKAAQSGKIARIKGFGPRSEKEILEATDLFLKNKGQPKRMTLAYAYQQANEIINYLKAFPEVLKVDPLGSLRRMVATIGDIDISVATSQPKVVIEAFVHYPQAKKLVEKGEEGATIMLKNGCSIDLRVQKPPSYGAMLQYFTGSKEHNIHLRELALKKGLSLSEHGIKIISQNKIETYASEEAFYQKLGLDWIPPEIRENQGEIEAAQKGNLPNLVNIKNIKGDLHTHSNFPIEESHDPGLDSMPKMIEKAAQLGYQYLGFTEHNPSQSQHSEKQIIKLIKAKKEAIEQINSSRGKKLLKHVFNGLEIDIKPDGCLAISEAALDLLDYGIASIHSVFNLSQKKMTARVIRGLSHPKIKILGHPTGRLLEAREGYELDWERIFAFCLKNNKWLEINAYPDRLDLPDFLVKLAVKNGVKMVINTDAHALKQLSYLFFGVSVARRGWAPASLIANCLPYDKMREQLLKGGEKKCH